MEVNDEGNVGGDAFHELVASFLQRDLLVEEEDDDSFLGEIHDHLFGWASLVVLAWSCIELLQGHALERIPSPVPSASCLWRTPQTDLKTIHSQEQKHDPVQWHWMFCVKVFEP